MKLRSCFRRHQLLFPAGCLLLAASSAFAQHRVVMKDGKTQEVTISGVTGSTVQIQVGAGTVGIPIAAIAEVNMPPPPEFTIAVAAFQARDYAKALTNAKVVVDKFKGLPAEWAQQATGLIGDIYLALNDPARAEASYKTLQKVYPGPASAQAEVGMARIAVSRKDYKLAREKIEPLTVQALKEKTVSKALAPAYSQAFYLLGQVKEAEEDFAGALQAYLSAVTIFPADRIAAVAAQERADQVRKERGVAIP